MAMVGQRVVRFLLKIFSAYVENIPELVGFSSKIIHILPVNVPSGLCDVLGLFNAPAGG
jgi:hypothetical protein